MCSRGRRPWSTAVKVADYVMLQRNLLYTGMTRGRRLVVLVGSKRALAIAVNSAQTTSRFTRLTERLRGSSFSTRPSAAFP